MPEPPRRPDRSELQRWSAGEVAAAVRSGGLTAVEVVEAQLAHLEAVNPSLNAVTRVNERAREDAAAVDRAIIQGWSPALAGVPVTIKDNVDVAADPTPNGLLALAESRADRDAPLVEHLRAAGAVVLGRTNTPEFSWRWHTDNPLFGQTSNPWDRGLTAGGSSGGAAAALAAGIGCLAQGNDAGGSIRWPANCTGVSGLRPTMGRVASHNVTAPGERPLGIELMAVQGPLARSAADLRLMLHVMAAPSWRDPSWVPAPLDVAHRRRAGWCPGAGMEPHPEVSAALDSACGALREDGWTVKPVEVPDLDVAAQAWASFINTDFHATNRQTMRQLGSPAISAMLDLFDAVGPAIDDVAGLYGLLSTRAIQLRGWQRLLTEDVDVVVLPVAMEPAWPAGDDTSSPERLHEIFVANTPLVAINLLGLPAAAQPTGVTGRRPNGVQIVARRFAESVAIDAAEAIERHLGLPALEGPPSA